MFRDRKKQRRVRDFRKRASRSKPTVRKFDVLKAAAELCKTVNYQDLTREVIAERAGISPSTINYHFGTMQQLRHDLVKWAIKHEAIDVIVQAWSARDSALKGVSRELLTVAISAYDF